MCRLTPTISLPRRTSRRLNEQFYKGDPASYLRQRLDGLMLMAAKGSEIDAILQDGVEYRGLRVRGSRPTSNDEREAFVFADTEVLYHHTTEVLLRLYFCHAGRVTCPPLALSRVRGAGQFKTMVRDRFAGDPEERHTPELADLFFGAPERTMLSPSPHVEMWEDSLTNLEDFFRLFAYHWLGYALLYNAAKHGLAVAAGPGGFSQGHPDDAANPTINHSGPSISYLEVKRERDGRRRWYSTTAFINVERTLALTYHAISMIREIWRVGRARYVDHRLNRVTMRERASVRDVVRIGASGIEPPNLSMSLVYYEPPAGSA